MKIRRAILGIDVQNDFTQPWGSLFVNGAQEDVSHMAAFIESYGANIDYVALTLDSHQPIHIANQAYWKDSEGRSPDLFCAITSADVASGKWNPQYNKELALNYLEELEQKGEVCTIWPLHCIMGGKGWAVDEALMASLIFWATKENKSYDLFQKGTHQATEHYSAFRAAVEYKNAEETKLNQKLLDVLDSFDEIFLVGEAADYCVVNSLWDMIEALPSIASKTIVLTDCMSWINQNNEKAKSMFEHAKKRGVRFSLSTDFK